MISLTNPHTIRGRPTLKDVERFRNGSFHEFCRLKALIILKEGNTSNVEMRKNVHEQNFDDEVKNNKHFVVNLPLLFNNLILFLFFMTLDTCNEQLDISYIINIIVQVMINVVLFYAWSSTLQHTENCLQNCDVLEKGNNFAHVHEYNAIPVSIKVEEVRSRCAKYVYGYRRVECRSHEYKRGREPSRVPENMLKRLSQKNKKFEEKRTKVIENLSFY